MALPLEPCTLWPWHNGSSVESLLGPLLPLFDRERSAGNALAVGVLIHTAGSTYRKPGALMLIAANGDYSGLLSGGCLEGDLREHALSVIKTGEPRIVSYDTRGPEDLIWGLGLGCEGAMRIFLLRVGPESDWQPLTHLARALESHTPTAVGVVVESSWPDLPVGSVALPQTAAVAPSLPVSTLATSMGAGGPLLSRLARATLEGPEIQAVLQEATRSGHVGWIGRESPTWKLFALALSLPPRVLLLGGGPDTLPIVDLAARLSWKVTVFDHRPAYADPAHFPLAERVVTGRPEELVRALDLTSFSAAVVMSHHLPSDLAYLQVMADSNLPYVGLLGPAPRREKLLADLGERARQLRPRLHAPVGLALGGRSPESIALAIVAEIHAFVHGANAQPWDGGRQHE